VDGLDIWTFNS